MPRIRPDSLGFTVLLGALAALPPLSIDMSLPALARLGAAFQAEPSSVGLTLSLFMAGYASAQLAFGPLSDRYGRRPVLIAGCALFALAGAGCAAAPSIEALIAWRLAEGAGAGAGTVLALAIVSDLFESGAARARLSYVNLVTGIAPMIAPTIGGAVMVVAGWRTIYALLAAGGAALTLAVALGLGESLARRDASALRPRRLAGNYGYVLRHPGAVGFALVGALSFGCLFAWVSGSALVLIDVMGVSTATYGWLFGATALGIMAGSYLNGWLSLRGVAMAWPLGAGLGLSLGAATALLALTLADAASLSAIMPLLVVNSFAFGLVMPNAAHGTIRAAPEIAGVAAATLGSLRMLAATLSSALVAFLFDGRSAVAMTGMMALFAAAAAAVYLGVVRPFERRGAADGGPRP